VADLNRSAKTMAAKPISKNQRRVARVAVGLGAFFFGFMAWQGIHYEEFWGKYGAVIKKVDRPVRYWTIFSFLSAGSATLGFYFLTWPKRDVAHLFPER
jgi:hypothetical protein